MTITRMMWNPSGDHYHPGDVTYRGADGSEETTSADRLPFPVHGDVELETMGVLVREGMCTKCGLRVVTSEA